MRDQERGRLGHNDKTNSDWEQETQNPLYYKIINVNTVLYSGWQSLGANVVLGSPGSPGSVQQVGGREEGDISVILAGDERDRRPGVNTRE